MKLPGIILLVLLGVSLEAQVKIPGLEVAGKTGTATRPPEKPPTPKEATLRWRNGEALPGDLVSATADSVTWHSSAFEEPLVIGWPSIRQYEQRLSPHASAEPFAFLLRDGSHLTGDLTSVSADSIGLRSARHGEVQLKRSEVLSVRRRQGKNLVYAGPAGDVGWRPYVVAANGQNSAEDDSGIRVPTLREGAGGALLLPFWNRAAALDLKLPEKIDLEFRVSSRTRPDFALYMEAGGKSGPRVETWDGELVVASGPHFKSLCTVGENEHSVTLRICCDRAAHTCSVWKPEGEKLADWSYTPESMGGKAGVVLQSKGRELTLEFLRVREWNGQPPAKRVAHEPRLEMTDGRAISGGVTAAAADWLTVRATGAEADESYGLSDVEALVFSDEAAKVAPQPATLLYADGTLLRGKLAAIHDGQAEVQTAFAAEPVPSKIADLRTLTVDPAADAKPAAEAPLADLDTIELAGLTMHGKLSGTGDERPRWLPVGGLGPVHTSASSAGVISRALNPGDPLPAAPALFYTTGGDVLAGRLRALDATGIEIESGMVALKHLTGEMLQAIQFGSASQSGIKGFDDAGWRLLKGDPKQMLLKDGVLHLEAEMAYGHPSAMQGSEISFAFKSDDLSAVRLRMFCVGTDPSKSINFAFQHFGDRMTLGLESVEGQLDNQFQMHVTGNPVTLRLLITEGQIEVFVNGSSVRKFSAEASKRAGSGLIIEPSSLWGNRVGAITISAFSAPPSPGRTWLPEVNAETKAEALTVPRFRKDAPPRHALIAANGDVLRGEILAATATHFAFRSGLEELRVPQDRVRAAIWLRKPDPAAPAAPVDKEDPVRKRLAQPMERNIGMSNAGLSSALSFLQQEASDLKFKLPEGTDRRRFHIQFGNETIGEALDKLCEMTGYHYHIDEAGTIVFEAAVRVSPLFTHRVYWLKPASFPEHGSPQTLLAAKGVVFPAGTAAEWRPLSGELVVSNTPENLTKLESVLATDFGGILGSPTHWLLMASGARLGLTVEKFGPEFIVGTHPLYGRCEVPLKEVFRIYTSEPPLNPVMTSLSNWRLVNAPEPVLPESGGESSALLGQEAKPIKLKMVGGGEFELAKEKGKVVVLDFWATWCGPCVKSLPALIEAMAPFPADKVKFVGLNQGEAPEQIEQFLEAREWKLPVALDSAQSVGQQYGADGIPYTVIIAPDGKVAYVKSGYTPDGDAEISAVVQKLLNPPKPPEPPAPSGASPVPSANSRGVPPERRG